MLTQGVTAGTASLLAIAAPAASGPVPAAAAVAAATRPAPEPLLSVCRFFDERCAGYLEAEDIEEILYMVAPDISSEYTSILCKQPVPLYYGLSTALCRV